jgi:hypothetical protein
MHARARTQTTLRSRTAPQGRGSGTAGARWLGENACLTRCAQTAPRKWRVVRLAQAPTMPRTCEWEGKLPMSPRGGRAEPGWQIAASARAESRTARYSSCPGFPKAMDAREMWMHSHSQCRGVRRLLRLRRSLWFDAEPTRSLRGLRGTGAHGHSGPPNAQTLSRIPAYLGFGAAYARVVTHLA